LLTRTLVALSLSSLAILGIAVVAARSIPAGPGGGPTRVPAERVPSSPYLTGLDSISLPEASVSHLPVVSASFSAEEEREALDVHCVLPDGGISPERALEVSRSQLLRTSAPSLLDESTSWVEFD
jgi:hypothetical protein